MAISSEPTTLKKFNKENVCWKIIRFRVWSKKAIMRFFYRFETLLHVWSLTLIVSIKFYIWIWVRVGIKISHIHVKVCWKYINNTQALVVSEKNVLNGVFRLSLKYVTKVTYNYLLYCVRWCSNWKIFVWLF